MELQITHHHENQSLSKTQKLNHKLKFNAEQATKSYLQSQLAKSAKKFDENLKTDISKKRKVCEAKVYSVLGDSPHDFLLILLNQRRQKLGDDLPNLEKQINKKQQLVIKDLKDEHLKIESDRKSMDLIKKELEQKLQLMRSRSSQTYLQEDGEEEIQRKIQEKRKHYLEFRQDGYWKMPNDNNRSALILVKNMKERKKRQMERYDSFIKRSLQNKDMMLREKNKEKEEKHQLERREIHERFQKDKELRQKQIQEEKKKEKEIQNFLNKFKNRAMAHVVLPEKYQKIQSIQKIKRIHYLQKLKEEKQLISLRQLKQGIQKYQEMNKAHQLQLQERRQIELAQERVAKSKLRKLYHSHHHSTVKMQQKQKTKIVDPRKISTQKVMKMIMYSKNAQRQHSPIVNQDLKQELAGRIEEQMKQKNKIKKIGKDGELILLSKQGLSPRRMGMMYLQQIKLMNSLADKKPPAPPISQKEIKLIDHSLIKNTFYNRRVTISNWQQILNKTDIGQDQKQRELQKYFKLIDQQQNKAISVKRRVSKAKSIQIQNKLDHYEVQKARAKLALLKSMQ